MLRDGRCETLNVCVFAVRARVNNHALRFARFDLVVRVWRCVMLGGVAGAVGFCVEPPHRHHRLRYFVYARVFVYNAVILHGARFGVVWRAGCTGYDCTHCVCIPSSDKRENTHTLMHKSKCFCCGGQFAPAFEPRQNVLLVRQPVHISK